MSKYSSYKEHQLITESWRRFLKEDRPAMLSDVDGEYLLSQMSPEARTDILNAVNLTTVDVQRGRLDKLDAKYVMDSLGRHGDAELEENEEELIPVIQVLLANENELGRMLEKFDMGEVDPDAHEL